MIHPKLTQVINQEHSGVVESVMEEAELEMVATGDERAETQEPMDPIEPEEITPPPPPPAQDPQPGPDKKWTVCIGSYGKMSSDDACGVRVSRNGRVTVVCPNLPDTVDACLQQRQQASDFYLDLGKMCRGSTLGVLMASFPSIQQMRMKTASTELL